MEPRFLRFLWLVLGALVLTFFLWPGQPENGPAHPQPVWDNFDAIRNETLGVEKIFAINLPGRPDKRDNIVLGSSLSGFRVDWIDGVSPENVHTKSYPYNWNYDHKPAEYAARRAHVNGMRRIVEERLGSAIIMEDDSDWDVSIKTQLQSFAFAVRALQDTPKAHTASPYGDDWDILWLGHCGVECKTHQPYHFTPNDPTIPASRHFLPYWRDPPPIERPEDMRLTCTANDGVCSLLYAVSYRGAQRILASLSVNPSGLAEEIDIGAQFDVSLGRMCGHGYLRCFTTFPALTGSFRSAGVAAKASDIHTEEGDAVGFESRGIVYSTMLNINRLLRGEKTVRATWEGAAVPDINPEDVQVRQGFTPYIGRKRKLRKSTIIV